MRFVLLVLFALFGVDSVVAAPPDQSPVPLPQPIVLSAQQRQDLLAQLHLSDFSLVNLPLPANTAGSALSISIPFQNTSYSLSLFPHSIRGRDFQVTTTDALGNRSVAASPPSHTYRGAVTGLPGSFVAASIVNDSIRARIRTPNETLWVQPLQPLVPNALPTQHLVYREADLLAGDWSCGADDLKGRAALDALNLPHASQGSIAGTEGACLFSADLAVEVDYEYFQLHAFSVPTTTDDIEFIINLVNAIYQNDCDIIHTLVEIHIQSAEPDPYTTTIHGDLLDEFVNHWNTNFTDLDRDVAHLFTGKELEGNVIGVAYLPGVCSDTVAYGLSQSLFTSNVAYRVALTAHELGHNWSAPHCNDDPACTIMCSAIASCFPDVSYFEPFTVGYITSYRNAVSCLSIPDQVPFGNAQFIPANGLAGDRYGVSVGIYGNAFIVGSYLNDDQGSNAGAAYIYKFTGSTWVQEAFLIADDAFAGDLFGSSVAIFGDFAVVGAPGDDDNGRSSGSVYVFRRTFNGSWQQEAKLIADDGSGSDSFGFSVSCCKGSRDTALIGAYLDNDTGSDSGSAYIFRKVGGDWEQSAKLVPDDATSQDRFGYSVAIAPVGGTERAVIGAYQADFLDKINGDISAAGAAYVFRRSGSSWPQEAKLLVPDPAAGDNFGSSVAICNAGPQQGNIILVGAWFADDLAALPVPLTNCGAAYAFRRAGNTWDYEAKLMASDRASSDRFGVSCALSSTDTSVLGLVGAYLADLGPLTNIGAAYNFHESATLWTEDSRVQGPGPEDNDQFGFALAMYNDAAVIAAWADDILQNPGPVNVPDIGSVNVYSSLTGVDCNQNGQPDACDIAEGSSLDENANSIPDECDSPTCPPDINSPPDGLVNIDDLTVLILNWGTHNEPADVTNDGIVNIDDLTAVILAWGSCS